MDQKPKPKLRRRREASEIFAQTIRKAAKDAGTDLHKQFIFDPAGGSLILVRHRKTQECCAAIQNVGGGRPFEVTFPIGERKHTFATLRSMVTARLWRRLRLDATPQHGDHDASEDEVC